MRWPEKVEDTSAKCQCGILALIAVSTFSALSVNAALLGGWEFEEGSGVLALDSSGNNFTGTLVGVDYAGYTPTGSVSSVRVDGPSGPNAVVVENFTPGALTNITLSTWYFPSIISPGSIPADASLIGHWRGDGSPLDTSGNGHDGTLMSGEIGRASCRERV